jgi:hypothetical protein
MATDHILALLVTDRDKLRRAIEALQGPTAPHETPSGSDRKAVVLPVEQASTPVISAAPAPPAKRKLSAAGKRAIIAGTKNRLAAIKAAKAAAAVPATTAPATPKAVPAKTSVAAKKKTSGRDVAYRKMMSAKMKAAWAKRRKKAA